MTTATATTSAYHWILTVQRNNGLASTRHAACTIEAGSTREAVLEHLIKTQFPGETVVVLFFSLEPNQL